MILSLSVLIGLCVLAGAFPETPAGRWVQRSIVVPFASCLNRVTPRHLLMALIGIAMLSAIISVLDADSIRLLSIASPEVASWFALFDVATYADVMFTALITASALRGRNMVAAAKAMLRLPVRRAGHMRSRRAHRPAPPHKVANDDEDGPMRIAA